MSITKEQTDYLYSVVNKDGMATFPTTDGRIFMFRSDYLRKLILTTTSPNLKFGIRQADGGIKDVFLGVDRLQSELDSAPTAEHILVLLTDGPIQN